MVFAVPLLLQDCHLDPVPPSIAHPPAFTLHAFLDESASFITPDGGLVEVPHPEFDAMEFEVFDWKLTAVFCTCPVALDRLSFRNPPVLFSCRLGK